MSPARHFSMNAESSVSTRSPADPDSRLDAAAAALIQLGPGPGSDVAQPQQGVEAEAVTLGTEARDLASGHRGDDRVPAKFLPPVHVGEMDLDDRQRDRGHRVAHGDRVVREGAGVQHDARESLTLGALQPPDELALEVGLAA